MSDHEGDDTDASAVALGRRTFLKGIAAVTSAAGALLAMTQMGLSTRAVADALPTKCSRQQAPMKNVEGKVAFITGGTSGIGLGIARAFVEAGMKIAITYRNKDQLNQALTHFENLGARVHTVDVDVADRAGMERAAAETVKIFGKVHVLVNNAGVIAPETLSATSYDAWDGLMKVNLNGPFNGIRAFLPHIRSHNEGGHIIMTSSILGLFAGSGGSGGGAYAVSKFALVGMTEALRAELAGTNIGASVFCPGTVTSNDPNLVKSELETGRVVLRGMRKNDLYILTRPEYEGIMRSIYATERERRRCAR
ncbi:MAG TPA: SDR family oxidoreductase [Steroidobacteraceae bacterium]|jgi:NAD(P)-dependent dehydrogenase (short-subunit alcohol dehydrogenase family)